MVSFSFGMQKATCERYEEVSDRVSKYFTHSLSLSSAPIHITGMNERMNQIRYSIWQRAGKAEEIEIANQIYAGLNPQPFKRFSTLSRARLHSS